MSRERKKTKKKVARLKMENPALGAQFELFLPEGWRVTKAIPAAKKKSSSRRKPIRKSRKD